jgi:hypothetical protein
VVDEVPLRQGFLRVVRFFPVFAILPMLYTQSSRCYQKDKLAKHETLHIKL